MNTHDDARWEGQPPANETDIRQMLSDAQLELPEGYLNLLRTSDGGNGDLGLRPGYFRLWPAREVVRNNEDYQVGEFLPGYFAFGDDGGLEMFAFKVRAEKPNGVYIVPFVPMKEEEAILIAEEFESFAAVLGKRWATS